MRRSLSFLTLLLSGALACGLILSPEDEKKLAKACDGQAVPGAAAFEGKGEGFAPFKQDAQGAAYAYDVNGVHFMLKRPASVSETRTVFCMDAPEEVPEDYCLFETSHGVGVAGIQVVEVVRSKGPTFPRISQQRKARLVDPSTGKTVAEHVIKNAAPDCEGFVGDPVEEAFRAQAPTGIAFADWVTEELGVKK